MEILIDDEFNPNLLGAFLEVKVICSGLRRFGNEDIE